MIVTADTVEKRKFYSNFIKIEKIEKVKRWGNKRQQRLSVIKYVKFFKKEIKYERLANIFDLIENRYKIARYCLEKVREECKIIKFNKSPNRAVVNNLLEKSSFDIEFLIKCEYFLFAIESCLDGIAHIINIMLELGISENNVNVTKVYNKLKTRRDIFTRIFLKNYKQWIYEFKEIRNKMTHHQIIDFGSKLEHNVNGNTAKFVKHVLSVKTERGEISKNLPEYFDEIIKGYENFSEEFYRKLNKENNYSLEITHVRNDTSIVVYFLKSVQKLFNKLFRILFGGLKWKNIGL